MTELTPINTKNSIPLLSMYQLMNNTVYILTMCDQTTYLTENLQIKPINNHPRMKN